jgi:LacI family transcriptional regulator
VTNLPHVALLIETSREYGRGLLRGIIRYQRMHRPWSLYFQPRGSRDPAPTWLRNWRGDGILARIESRAMASAVRRTGIPAVDLRFAVPRLGLPAVGIDNHTVVRAAFDHFLSRGYRRFAFCGVRAEQSIWMDYRRRLFERLTTEAGYTCDVFVPPARAASDWEREQKRLTKWVRGLGTPVAVLACNDERGLQVLDACRRAGVRVPDEAAVLGVDNDEFLCGLATPPLSSVDIDVEHVGYRAAELLDRLMGGEPWPSEPILLPAAGVVARRSTDGYAVEDADLASALRFLRDHACDGLRMRDVTRATGMERRTLERRLKATLGHSPKEEVTRIQIEEARRLLSGTDLPVKIVACRAGFANGRYFSRVFRTRAGASPIEFRRQFGGSRGRI